MKIDNKGFTLIELLVAISIITFLSSILLTFVGDSRTRAASAASAEQARQVKNAVLIDTLDNNYPSQYSGGGGGGSVTYKAKDVPRIVSNIGGDSESFPKIPPTVSNEEADEYYYVSDGDDSVDTSGTNYYCVDRAEPIDFVNPSSNGGALVVWRNESVTRNNDEGKNILVTIEPISRGSGSFWEQAQNENIVAYGQGLVAWPGNFGSPPPGLEKPWIVYYNTPGPVQHPFLCEAL
jgi:prepilin-type N-terminal cleavage/methylation domain-containing protein